MRVLFFLALVLSLPLFQGCSSQLSEESAVIEPEDDTGTTQNKE